MYREGKDGQLSYLGLDQLIVVRSQSAIFMYIYLYIHV